MRMDLQGRLRNTTVAVTDALLPVIEAIVNSIHSIEDRFGFQQAATKGRIGVRVHRVQQHQLPGAPRRAPADPVAGFTIADNGVGFTDENLESFRTADSRHKIARGGKGIGRLTWLVVFERAEISSRFQGVDGRTTHRAFTFSPAKSGISGFTEEPLRDGEAVGTRVHLAGVQARYQEALRKSLEFIAERVFEHCFNHVVVGKCPRVTLAEDSIDAKDLVVNDAVRELDISSSHPLRVGGHDLKLRHVQQKLAPKRKHLGHLVADNRVVSSFQLSDVSDLSADPIHGDGGQALVHHALVSGEALDAAVDSNRTSFDLPDDEPLAEAAGLLDLRAVRQAVGRAVNDRLKDTLAAERKRNIEKVEHHIRTKQPEYGRLLGRKRNELARIKWPDDPVQRDEALYRVKQRWEREIRQQQAEVERKLVKSQTDVEEMAEQIYHLISETNLSGKDDLVRYVAKRRAVLKVLKQLIGREDGVLDKHIHRIIFPLKRTNGELDYEDHNLWLIDDTLSFYEFISSDIPLSVNTAAPSDSLRRPDILAFKTGDPYQHISIIEFKRPDEATSKNPVIQLAEYARLLREGGSVDVDGVALSGIPMNIRIDAYAIVTLNQQMESLLRYGRGEMKQVEGEWRWYGLVGSVNMSVEILDYKAFLSRAQQRSQAFFRTLNLR